MGEWGAVLYQEGGNTWYRAKLDLIIAWNGGMCCLGRLGTCGTVRILI